MPIEIRCPDCNRKYEVSEKHIGLNVVCGHEECGARFIAVARTMQEDATVADESFEFAEFREDSKELKPDTVFQPPISTEASKNGENDHGNVSSNALAKIDSQFDVRSISGPSSFVGLPEIGDDPAIVSPPVVFSETVPAEVGSQEPKTDVIVDASEPSRKQFWGMAKKVWGDASTHVSNAGVAVTSKAASLGSSGVAKATEIGKQTFVAANSAVDASGAKEAIKATVSVVSGKLDEVSGKRLVELLEKKLQVQDSYNDILATRLAEALDRITVLEDRINILTSKSSETEMTSPEVQR